MFGMQGTLNSVERSMRCVFVGNIPYEATEEQLKDIFSEVGPVVSFRFFYDPDSGKPKGYGFCEYRDQEMAISAVRNLNGFEFKGRALHVDIAGSEKSREELESLEGCLSDHGTTYVSESTTEKAPEEISKAVASLPAEQMFELMKQMKMCIENNPHEARNLLLQNPQLAYALLQAQVIMRIVDPEVAMKILNRSAGVPPTGLLANPDVKQNVESVPQMIPPMSEAPSFASASMPSGPAAPNGANSSVPGPRLVATPSAGPLLGDRPPVMSSSMPVQFSDRDLRTMGDQDLRQPPLMDRDMRTVPMLLGDKDMRQPLVDQDFRIGVPQGLSENRPFDPRFRGMQGSDINRQSGSTFDRSRPAANIDPRTAYEGRTANTAPRVEDPRKASAVPPSVPHIPQNARLPTINTTLPSVPPNLPNAISSVRPSAATIAAANASASILAPHDQEKAALILQVLQLSDQQIALLPMEQRQSIMVLKEQIARSQI